MLPISGSNKIYVIHGYGCPKLMMKRINKCLLKENYNTENYGYNSISEDLDSLGNDLYRNIQQSHIDTVSFVTHSMGALVVRAMLKYSLPDVSFPKINRIVMIAPPNEGAEIADFYSSFKILKLLLGPNIEHMRTDSGSYAKNLPIPYNSEVGIIIGIRGKVQGYNPFIKGDNDGFLTPKRTKLGIEKDVAIVKDDHGRLTQDKNVRKLIVEFLKTGTFISNIK